jgi:hypothetical protein
MTERNWDQVEEAVLHATALFIAYDIVNSGEIGDVGSLTDKDIDNLVEKLFDKALKEAFDAVVYAELEVQGLVLEEEKIVVFTKDGLFPPRRLSSVIPRVKLLVRRYLEREYGMGGKVPRGLAKLRQFAGGV